MARKKPDAVSGVLVINKHEGVTSHRIIQILRRLYDTSRVGHTGTLDPMATGVLPVLIGRAVKASEYVTAYDKRYIAEMKLGVTTDTEDATGSILSEYDGIPPIPEKVKSAAESFIGDIEQIPPMYSAIKIDGRKLLDIAREGGEVERKPRPVRIYNIEVEQVSEDTYKLDVSCSKGTYIRTLCADIGKKLGCGAVMSALTRVRSGSFTLDNSYTIEEIEKMSFEERLALPAPAESLFEEYKRVELSEFYAKLFLCGAALFMDRIGNPSISEGEFAVVKRGELFLGLGVSQTDDEGRRVLKAEKLFYLPETNGLKNKLR